MKRDVVDNLELLVLTYKQLEAVLQDIQDYLNNADAIDPQVEREIALLHQGSIMLAMSLDINTWAEFAAYVAMTVGKIDPPMLEKIRQREAMSVNDRVKDIQTRVMEDDNEFDQGTKGSGSSGSGSTGSDEDPTLN